MLNLIDLERKLDLALSEETTESLTHWLISKRLLSGEGIIDKENFIFENEPIPVTQKNYITFEDLLKSETATTAVFLFPITTRNIA